MLIVNKVVLYVHYSRSSFSIFTLKLMFGTPFHYCSLLQTFSACVLCGSENVILSSDKHTIIFMGHNFVKVLWHMTT